MHNLKSTSQKKQACKADSITKAERKDIAYLRALESTLSEWNSDNDNENYKEISFLSKELMEPHV